MIETGFGAPGLRGDKLGGNDMGGINVERSFGKLRINSTFNPGAPGFRFVQLQIWKRFA